MKVVVTDGNQETEGRWKSWWYKIWDGSRERGTKNGKRGKRHL